jgi:HEPN domain-containing protein
VANRAKDWLKQAERDLEQARAAAGDRRFEWACFISHQAAEKAVKALHLHNGQEAWGHVVSRLLAELPASSAAPLELTERARVLDTFDIPTRYPDSHAEGAPFEHYGSLQGEEALSHAGAIVAFVGSEMAEG